MAQQITKQTLIFTFHNVSINSNIQIIKVHVLLNLHSIMYLLIPSNDATMEDAEEIFTFHNVSINSIIKEVGIPKEINLHSIMYLLILIL